MLCSCSKQYIQYDTSLQISRSTDPGHVFILALVKSPSTSKTSPDTGLRTFSLEPGETKTASIDNKFYPGRKYTFTATVVGDFKMPTVRVTTAVFDGDELLFRSTQQSVSWGF